MVFHRGQDFYQHMLSLVDGSKQVDLCGMEGTKRSTQCYGFEFLWHVVQALKLKDRPENVRSLGRSPSLPAGRMTRVCL